MIFLTEIRAIDPQTNELTDWCGPRIEAANFEDAQNYCNKNGLGYCNVIGPMDKISDLIIRSCEN
jgi:hypothetical protein